MREKLEGSPKSCRSPGSRDGVGPHEQSLIRSPQYNQGQLITHRFADLLAKNIKNSSKRANGLKTMPLVVSPAKPEFPKLLKTTTESKLSLSMFHKTSKSNSYFDGLRSSPSIIRKKTTQCDVYERIFANSIFKKCENREASKPSLLLLQDYCENLNSNPSKLGIGSLQEQCDEFLRKNFKKSRLYSQMTTKEKPASRNTLVKATKNKIGSLRNINFNHPEYDTEHKTVFRKIENATLCNSMAFRSSNSIDKKMVRTMIIKRDLPNSVSLGTESDEPSILQQKLSRKSPREPQFINFCDFYSPRQKATLKTQSTLHKLEVPCLETGQVIKNERSASPESEKLIEEPRQVSRVSIKEVEEETVPEIKIRVKKSAMRYKDVHWFMKDRISLNIRKDQASLQEIVLRGKNSSYLSSRFEAEKSAFKKTRFNQNSINGSRNELGSPRSPSQLGLDDNIWMQLIRDVIDSPCIDMNSRVMYYQVLGIREQFTFKTEEGNSDHLKDVCFKVKSDLESEIRHAFRSRPLVQQLDVSEFNL
jgi:hypothetical protein